MFKLTSIIAAALFLGSSWYSGDVIPRMTHSAADYVLMPLLGYLVIIVAAHFAVRFLPETK
jgi:exosortase/archaeosortase